MATSKGVFDYAADLPRPAVMCTIVRVRGSAPQQVGARMWTTRDSFLGTIGGGHLEKKVLGRARRLLRAGEEGPRLEEVSLQADAGQVCGGRVEIFFEPVQRRRAVHLLGGGHVGRAVAGVLSGMPLEIVVVDGRAEWASPGGLPRDVSVRHVDPKKYVRSRKWSSRDAVCVFTHSHEVDFPLGKRLLKEPVGYLGMIASRNKARVFRSRLGPALRRAWDRKMRCPIGLPLRSKNPKVIAVAVAAQLLEEWGLKDDAAGSSKARR